MALCFAGKFGTIFPLMSLEQEPLLSFQSRQTSRAPGWFHHKDATVLHSSRAEAAKFPQLNRASSRHLVRRLIGIKELQFFSNVCINLLRLSLFSIDAILLEGRTSGRQRLMKQLLLSETSTWLNAPRFSSLSLGAISDIVGILIGCSAEPGAAP